MAKTVSRSSHTLSFHYRLRRRKRGGYSMRNCPGVLTRDLRIEPDLSECNDQLEQVGVLIAENVFVTALKQMTDELVFAVEVQRVALLQAPALLWRAASRQPPTASERGCSSNVSVEVKIIAFAVLFQQV